MGYLMDLIIALFGILIIGQAFNNSGLLFIVMLLLGIVLLIKGASNLLGFFSGNESDNDEE